MRWTRNQTSRSESKSGYNTGDFTITALHEQADEQLFRALKYNPIHPLHRLLPSEHSTPYLTRSRVHNYELLSKTAALTSAILFTTACCTRTAISVLIFSLFSLFNSDLSVIFNKDY